MYHIKMLLKYTVTEQVFYEESIVKVNADSFNEAYNKAKNYVNQTIDAERWNLYGNKVQCSVLEYLDCFHSNDSENDVQEVYSRIFQNHSGLSETDLLQCLGKSCTRKEMLPLRYYPDKKDI